MKQDSEDGENTTNTLTLVRYGKAVKQDSISLFKTLTGRCKFHRRLLRTLLWENRCAYQASPRAVYFEMLTSLGLAGAIICYSRLRCSGRKADRPETRDG